MFTNRPLYAIIMCVEVWKLCNKLLRKSDFTSNKKYLHTLDFLKNYFNGDKYVISTA